VCGIVPHALHFTFIKVVIQLLRIQAVAYKDRDTLFIFLDESGNFDFSPRGTRYWSVTALCTFHPTNGRHVFLDLLYHLADSDAGQECFHATEDKQEVRDKVFECIRSLEEQFEVHSVIAEKRKTHPSLYQKRAIRKGKPFWEKDETKFYNLICKVLLGYIFQRPTFSKAQRIVVVLSSIFNNPKHTAIRGSLPMQLKAHTKAPFSIYFHQTKADLNCQIADYCGWAISRKWENADIRSYDLMRSKIRSEFPIFHLGNRTFY
jgi:hypothetical protein